jgi:hypothetical protein
MSTITDLKAKFEAVKSSVQQDAVAYVTALETSVKDHKGLVIAAAVVGLLVGGALGHYL